MEPGQGHAGRPDSVLVDRLCRGDEGALGDIYDGYAGLVHGLARRVLRDRRAAEDVTQEVFVAVWQHPDRFDPTRGTLRSFLATMTHRRAIDVVRRDEARYAREARTTEPPEHMPDPGTPRCRASTPNGCETPSPCSRWPNGGRWSSPTSAAARTGRSPSSWASPKAPPSPDCAWRSRPSPALRGEMSERWA